MIKLEYAEILGWEHAIRGMRNPLNSWNKTDSFVCKEEADGTCPKDCRYAGKCPVYGDEEFFVVGNNDLDLMKRLRNAGSDHRKYMRMLTVYVDITAPLYWWKEFDTYKVGTVANSCSTMHKIHAKEFELGDFSYEHLTDFSLQIILQQTVDALNHYRSEYLRTKEKFNWWQMIQLLPTSYNQKRTVMLNYEVLANIYKSRKNHKLDEWQDLCEWIKALPYSELITG